MPISTILLTTCSTSGIGPAGLVGYFALAEFLYEFQRERQGSTRYPACTIQRRAIRSFFDRVWLLQKRVVGIMPSFCVWVFRYRDACYLPSAFVHKKAQWQGFSFDGSTSIMSRRFHFINTGATFHTNLQFTRSWGTQIETISQLLRWRFCRLPTSLERARRPGAYTLFPGGMKGTASGRGRCP